MSEQPAKSYREMLINAHETASRDFDRALMTLAGGALAISISFVHDVAPSPRQTWTLGTAWVLFACSLVLILSSFLTSQSALLRIILELDHPEAVANGSHRHWTKILNVSSAACFCVGVLFLVVFALYNV